MPWFIPAGCIHICHCVAGYGLNLAALVPFFSSLLDSCFFLAASASFFAACVTYSSHFTSKMLFYFRWPHPAGSFPYCTFIAKFK
jgi:hypothetical protein